MAWRVHAAAVIGKSHIDGGLPCQDAFAYALRADTLLAVVCDGAGSQPLSDVGARFLSSFVVSSLADAVERGQSLASLPTENFHARILEIVGTVREALAARAHGEAAELVHYSATLVGAVLAADGGYLFHVGDGLAVAQLPDEGETCVISLPENGEYANETYFVSGELWQEHLRCTRVEGPVGTLALMSDGAMPFVMAKGNAGFFTPFMEPVSRFLATKSASDGDAALAGTLGDERTWQITGDDKTLLLASWQ